MSRARRLVEALEALGGARPLPVWARTRTAGILLGIYWLGLVLAAMAFAGRGVKFIYIDF